jgi:hypothetical protein
MRDGWYSLIAALAQESANNIIGDAAKFGICGIRDLHVLVAGKKGEPDLLAEVRNAGVEVLQA